MDLKSQSSYFSHELFKFLRELARNNNRPWFAENKNRYERVVQQPCLRFIRDAGPVLNSISPSLVADPRPYGGSLFRIYRDIRFSKDKSPYKTNVAMEFWHKKTRKDGQSPGLYLHVDSSESFLGSGVWHPETPTLSKIRQAIINKPESWKKVRHTGLRLSGDSLKRPPMGFNPDHQFIDDLKRKDFISAVSFTPRQITGPNFMQEFVRAGRSMNPLNKFPAEAMRLKW